MNRRNFVKFTAIATPIALALLALRKSYLHKVVKLATNKNRMLVLIQLNGGNDSLNTIIPVGNYDVLSQLRKNILIPESKILKLKDTAHYGFHPSLTGLQRLYNDDMISIVQGVSYPFNDRSHFHSIDVKFKADLKPEKSNSGWIGRYLQGEYPGYSNSGDFHFTSGPPSMRIGEVDPVISRAADIDYGLTFKNLDGLNFSAPDIPKSPVAENEIGNYLTYIRDIFKQSEMFVPILKSAFDRQKSLSKLYPEEKKNLLADQLKLVARLIGGGLNSRVYVVNQLGYDTHAEQVDHSDTTVGQHARLLADLSEAITAFEDDLHLMGKQDNVLGMTFSEFGRRVKSEDSLGTDHGRAESVILFGTRLRERMIGAESKNDIKMTDEDIPMQYDFRSLYASVLSGWFGVPNEKLKKIIPQCPEGRLELFTS